ncbi:isopentenyl phosphate kinase [Candidatus Methanomassiliicoccus intestinalis]|uniref:isopentenyl phosphate kinase n=1 Tax=Candidatus Methanomassiliicoccus intestinalis TaxID=1406512 RepID=UPI0037DD60EE
MILIKLGGSVITDKTKYKTLRTEVLGRLASEIKASGQKVILVHGAGSYGHIIAAENELQKGFFKESQVPAASQVMEDVRVLNLEVIKCLNEAGLPCASLPPSAIAKLQAGELKDLDCQLFADYLELGIVPVTFGDVCLDTERGFGICSGDQLMTRIAETFKPTTTIFCSDVDGVYTADPHSDTDARLIETIDQKTLDELPRSQRCADVTGSIFKKIEHMLNIATYSKALVINGLVPGRLKAALCDEEVVGSKVERIL